MTGSDRSISCNAMIRLFAPLQDLALEQCQIENIHFAVFIQISSRKFLRIIDVLVSVQIACQLYQIQQVDRVVLVDIAADALTGMFRRRFCRFFG